MPSAGDHHRGRLNGPIDVGSGQSPADEPVEVIGPDGTVVDVVSRSRMRAEGLAHRATFVITVLAPPPRSVVAVVDETMPGRLEQWLSRLAWPLVGPDHGALPVTAPPTLWPAAPLSPDTSMVVHRRADWKDVHPGFWDLAFGGVCTAGEGWFDSARRELAEEAGLAADARTETVTLAPVAAARYVDDRSETFGAVFVAFSEIEPEPADGEVVAVDLVALGRVGDWAGTREVCPDSKALVLPVVAGLIDPARSDR